jgi:hypothetical protein
VKLSAAITGSGDGGIAVLNHRFTKDLAVNDTLFWDSLINVSAECLCVVGNNFFSLKEVH